MHTDTLTGPPTSADLLRAAATTMTATTQAFPSAVAVVLDSGADRWEHMVAATQQPSPGVDCPAAIYYGNPEKAVSHADTVFADLIRIAHTWLDANPEHATTKDPR